MQQDFVALIILAVRGGSASGFNLPAFRFDVFVVFAHGHVSVANVVCACPCWCIGGSSRRTFGRGVRFATGCGEAFPCRTENQSFGSPGACNRVLERPDGWFLRQTTNAIKIMKCPHCLTDFHDMEEIIPIGQDADSHWFISRYRCSACERIILSLGSTDVIINQGQRNYTIGNRLSSLLFRPKAANRPPPAPQVPRELAKDYIEACLVIADSAQASAALSRRCLQYLLRKYAGVKSSDLSKEIDELLAKNLLPSHLADSIDAVRNIGNFAAHPMKSKTTGEIVEVETGEAEWNLDVLESLFDFFFIQPAILKAKREALNKKLTEAGKPPLK